MSLTDLEKFLLDLALKAHPEKFLPFPDRYRVAPIPSQEDEKCNAKYKPNHKMISSSTLGASFTPYTPDEHASVYQDLLKLQSNPDGNPYLREYLSKIELGMTQHGPSSIHSSITEYEFRYSPLEERIRDINYPKRWYLFHGSPIENWHSILRNGLRNMSNTTYMTDGATEGIGVYLADDIRTSYRYGSKGGYFGNQKGLHCISVVEILTDPTPYKVPAGWYVIPNDKLLVVRYLLKMDSCPSFTGKDILEYYGRMTNRRIEDKSIIHRINSEEKSLAMENISVLEKITPTNWTVLFDNAIIRLYLRSYPFYPPIIQLAYEVEGSDEHPEYIEPYIPDDWSPAATLGSAIQSFKENIFPGISIPEMTNKAIPSLIIE